MMGAWRRDTIRPRAKVALAGDAHMLVFFLKGEWG